MMVSEHVVKKHSLTPLHVIHISVFTINLLQLVKKQTDSLTEHCVLLKII